MTDLGLYLHVPFCERKCGYCDFYSFPPKADDFDRYTARLYADIKTWGARLARPLSSVYFGGGTPSLLGGERISYLLKAAKDSFGFSENAEITAECNPADELYFTLEKARREGLNRVSIGVQSANKSELTLLGRRHTTEDASRAVFDARRAGIDNISLDLMIGLPGGNGEKLKRSLDFIVSLAPRHVSVYILKLEPNTPLYLSHPNMPSDDEAAEQYLFAAEYLEQSGFRQYEISNFAVPGFESRHNLRYWDCREYLGLGAAAHSFIDGKRFFFPRDFSRYIAGCDPEDDGEGGSAEEYAMLRLRLRDGIIFSDYEKRFGKVPEKLKDNAKRLKNSGLLTADETGIKLTRRGFLVSNAVIGELL